MPHPPSSPDAPPPERLRVGDCLVDVPLREVCAPGARRPMRITPKSMGVLRVLADNAGRVVSREALLAEVWPDTLPTNDVVTQAVTQLRKAFAEGGPRPRFIETIAKSGYRLLVDVERLPAEPAHEPVHVVPAAAVEAKAEAAGALPSSAPAPVIAPAGGGLRDGLRRHAVWGMGLSALALLVAAFGGWQARRGHGDAAANRADVPAPAERPYRLITSEPGFELSPSLSPDGSQVAYLVSRTEEYTDTAIVVQTTEPAQPRTLTFPPDGAWDSNPQWSPNGREIAFLRRFPGQDCRIMAVPASGGDPRVLADCDPHNRPSFDWTPDGNGLVFSSPMAAAGEPGLRLLDLTSGGWHALRYGARVSDMDSAPRYSPDGRWIAFVRNNPLGDLWRIPAGGGPVERLTTQRAELRGWDWTRDGKAIVFGRRVDAHTRLYRLDLADRGLTDLGIEDAQAPAIAAKADLLAFVQRKAQFGLYRTGPRGQDGALGRERLFASTGRDTLPAVAPDGRQIVFASDRSGEYALWWADMTRPGSLRPVEGFRPESRYLPIWSSDSERLLVIGTDAGGRYGLYELMPASGQSRVVETPVPAADLLFAAYMPDPVQILLIAGTEDGQQLLLYDRSAVPWRRLAAMDGVSLARVDAAQRRILLTRRGRDGLWQADLVLSPSSLRQIDGHRPASQRYRTWTVGEDGQVVYLEQLPDCYVSLRRIGPGRSPAPSRCVEPLHLATVNGFSAHARSHSVYLSMALDDGTNIGFMPLPASPRGAQAVDP